MRERNFNSFVVLSLVIITLLFSCRKEAADMVPSVTFVPLTSITADGAVTGGEIVSEGGLSVTAKGVCWSTHQNPTISDFKTINGTGIGSFTSFITGLSPGVTYYLRAYAINEVGVGYSSQTAFTTMATVPVLTTLQLTAVTINSVSTGGNITADGGAQITARGICWSTTQNPTTANYKTSDGTGSGSFTSSVSGLSAGTIYYFRAYATNSAGTGYGNQLSVITMSGSQAVTDGSSITLQKSTIGKGIDLVFMGDGYTVSEISSKKYENDIRQALTSFFNIEPYKTYSAYFNAYMVYAVSESSGISDLTTTRQTKFETKYTGTGTSTSMSANITTTRSYVQKAPVADINNTVAIIIANSTRYGGTTYMHGGYTGLNTSICPLPPGYSSYILQHEAGGHGFGNLADEYVTNTGPMPETLISQLLNFQSYGTFMNVDTTANLTRIRWNYFVGLPNYTYVKAYEGGDLYSQGIWRPEYSSIMINNVRYFNAPSREIIVKRIKKLSGQTYSFSEFQSKDVMELTTRSAGIPLDKSMLLPPPVIVK